MIGATTLPLTVPGWDAPKEDGEKLIAAAERQTGDGLEIKLGGDPIYAAQETTSPEGLGVPSAPRSCCSSPSARSSPPASCLVIALVGLGISSGGLIVLLANVVDAPDWTTAVSGLIGIGVGIDYALLVLTRFRAAMHAGKDRHDSILEAVTTAGRSVVLAGATVVIAVLGLALTGLLYMYGVAIAASLAVLVVMVAAAISPLPALLAYLGPNVDRLRLPLVGRRKPAGRGQRGVVRVAVEPRCPAPAVAGGDRRDRGAARAGGSRARHAAGLPRRRKRPAEHDDPPGLRPQHRGLPGPGSNGPLVVAAELPDASAEAEIDSFADRVRRDPGVARSSRRINNDAGDAALVTVIPKGSPQDAATEELVHRLRDTVVPQSLGGTGIRTEIGGVTAALED